MFWIYHYFICNIFMTGAHGILVAEIAMDGLYTEETYLNHSLGIGPQSLTDFTLCQRMNLNYLRPIVTYSLSYTSFFSDNTLNIETRFNGDKLYLSVCKLKYVAKECGTYHLDGVQVHHEWYHICLVLKSKKLTSFTWETETILYINGIVVHEDKISLKKDKYHPLYSGGSFIIGQEQDGQPFGGLFDKNQAFSGKITQTELWNVNLSSDEISDIANCFKPTVKSKNRVVTWGSRAWDIFNVNMKEVPIETFCQTNILSNLLIYPEGVSNDVFKVFCDVVDGQFPIITENSQDKVIHEKYLKVFKELNETFPGNDQCFLSDEKIKFHMGMQRNRSTDKWYNPYDFSQDISKTLYIFTGTDNEVVSYNVGGKLEPTVSTNKFPCGICQLPKSKIVYLKGLCDEDSRLRYDDKYYIYGVHDDRPYFKGLAKSHIFYDAESNKWKIQSLINPDRYLETEMKMPNSVPLGTVSWKTGTENSLCGYPDGFVTSMTLSQCFPNKYTCDSGHCIDLHQKCNTEINCEDKTDESHCQYLRIGSDYAKENLPVDDNGEPCIIYINASVLAFPFINTVNLKFTADFYLNLRWYDLRLGFMDLNNVTYLNTLTKEDKNSIWVPTLSFLNALGPYSTVVDESTSGVLVRLGKPLPEEISLTQEAMLFSGRENSIYLTREYFQEYSCQFDLHHYPFDTQMCQMDFEVQGKTEQWLKLEKDGTGVEFLASRLLVEYEIQKEILQIGSKNNISRAHLKFVFRRRMEYHVTNTFLQTLILVMVGYLSFFFDLENFTDRAMIVLTTMLVIATITSTIQQGLPRTSYYKLIDWWLLVCMNILVTSLGFHTYLAHVISKAKDEPMMSIMSGSRIFGRKITPENSKEETDDNANLLKHARRLNLIAKIGFAVFMIIFNLVFWSIAITEYLRPADEYITPP